MGLGLVDVVAPAGGGRSGRVARAPGRDDRRSGSRCSPRRRANRARCCGRAGCAAVADGGVSDRGRDVVDAGGSRCARGRPPPARARRGAPCRARCRGGRSRRGPPSTGPGDWPRSPGSRPRRRSSCRVSKPRRSSPHWRDRAAMGTGAVLVGVADRLDRHGRAVRQGAVAVRKADRLLPGREAPSRRRAGAGRVRPTRGVPGRAGRWPRAMATPACTPRWRRPWRRTPPPWRPGPRSRSTGPSATPGSTTSTSG